MNCPVCDGHLRTVQKYGVEVDICPDCKGVWLDRGEIDKIIEIAASGEPSRSDNFENDRKRQISDSFDHHHKAHDDDRYEHHNDTDKKTGHSKRRGSWISDIFESFGGD